MKKFYTLPPSERVKVVEEALKELEKSEVSYEARTAELHAMRGEYPQNDFNSQLNDLIILFNNQYNMLINMGQIINLQSQAMNEMQQKLNTLLNRTADIEISNNNIDDSVRETIDGVNQLAQEIQDVKNSIDNIKVYQLPHDYYK